MTFLVLLFRLVLLIAGGLNLVVAWLQKKWNVPPRVERRRVWPGRHRRIMALVWLGLPPLIREVREFAADAPRSTTPNSGARRFVGGYPWLADQLPQDWDALVRQVQPVLGRVGRSRTTR